MGSRTRRDIVCPGVTRFASSFLTLQNFIEKKDALKHTVILEEWENTKWSQSKKGKEAYTTISSSGFWNGVSMCLKVFTPLVRVLRLVEEDVKPAMGFVYGELQKAKEEIKEVFKHKEEKYKLILDVVETKGRGRIDTPLHLMAYFLNPYYYYNSGSNWSNEEMENIMDGVYKCMERMYPDIEMQHRVINVELVKYRGREGPFGRALSARGCMKNDNVYDPVGWWDMYGNHTPNLQKVAKRILSLTTSSSGCERNWSIFEGMHTRKVNKLDTVQMNNLVYVQFNARLLKKKMKIQNDKIDVLLANEASHAQSWIVDGVDDGEGEVIPSSSVTSGMVSDTTRADEELQPRSSGRHVEEVRELEDDFVSDDMEDGEDIDEESDFEWDEEVRVVEDDFVSDDMEDMEDMEDGEDSDEESDFEWDEEELEE